MLKIWKPSVRCDRCRALRPLGAVRAWLLQPVGPTTGRGDGGRTHFVCSRCKIIREAGDPVPAPHR